jgi:uncharacterized protein VirK/YbjX
MPWLEQDFIVTLLIILKSITDIEYKKVAMFCKRYQRDEIADPLII